MKKYVIGLILGVAVSIPTGIVFADKVIKTPETNPIYNVSKFRNDADVSVFDDAGNKCYVYHDRYNKERNGISCVRQD